MILHYSKRGRVSMICALFTMLGFGSVSSRAVAEDYTDGIVIINEGQFGAADSSINYLQPGLGSDFWQYDIFAKENPDRFLGVTACFGAYHGDKLYIVAKEASSPGSDDIGGILSVLDASSMKLLAQIDHVDGSGARADGRAFLGVDSHKGYISTSNGIWVVNLDNNTVTGQIEGSENPNGTDNLSTANPDCGLYHGQCGMMVLSGSTVFAAHQAFGLLVIDAVKDEVVKTVSMDIVEPGAGIGSIVKAKDGSVWLSVAASINGDGMNLNALVKVNPETFDTEVVRLPEGIYGPATSWGTWNPDTFCATAQSNSLVWVGAEVSWYANALVYRYDIESNSVTNIIDLADTPEGLTWKIYNASMRVDPADDVIYMGLFKDYASLDYMVRSYSIAGEELRDYPMKKKMWFPGQMLFPASELAGVEQVSAQSANAAIEVMCKNSMLTVNLPAGTPDMKISIFDASGRIVAQETFSEGVNTFAFGHAQGIYLLVSELGSVKFVAR